jgi:hypothetical protein
MPSSMPRVMTLSPVMKPDAGQIRPTWFAGSGTAKVSSRRAEAAQGSSSFRRFLAFPHGGARLHFDWRPDVCPEMSREETKEME